LSSLTAIFGNSEEKTHDSDKLMELYWNRAELKKEFAEMRKERYRLQDRIKEQQGATARIQQRLDHLEELLMDPDWAHNVVVFYQLRSLGKRCQRKLARFAEQLKQQREQKRHHSVLEGWNEQRKQEALAIEAQIAERQDHIKQLEDRLQAEQRSLTSMSAMVRLFRGRSAMNTVDASARELEVAMHEQQLLLESVEEIMSRKPPDHQGLDLSAKRSINLMIIAFAQQLYVQFDEDGIAAQVKESTEKSVGAINYGTRYECGQLLDRIRKSMEKVENATEFADVLKRRALLLGEKARFPDKQEAVPAAGSVSTLYKIDAKGLVRESEVNIVGQNYWGINKIFSR